MSYKVTPEQIQSLSDFLYSVRKMRIISLRLMTEHLKLDYPDYTPGCNRAEVNRRRNRTKNYISRLITKVALVFPNQHDGLMVVRDRGDGSAVVTSKSWRVNLVAISRLSNSQARFNRVVAEVKASSPNTNNPAYKAFFILVNTLASMSEAVLREYPTVVEFVREESRKEFYIEQNKK